MTDFSTAVWRKSTHSGQDYGQCVELAKSAGHIGIRDSKQHPSPILRLTPHNLSYLLATLKLAPSPEPRPTIYVRTIH